MRARRFARSSYWGSPRFLCFLSLLFLPLIASYAGAGDLPADLRTSLGPKSEAGGGDGARDGREGGESWNDAMVIGAIPFTDTGATCDNADNLVFPCASSQAPDVFYSYVPPVDQRVTISLCGSGYDTALGVYDAGQNNLACNDNFCDRQSEIYNLFLAAGQTYYIVVDGYSTSCGSYTIHVEETPSCQLECPGGAVVEGEPPCVDDYYDQYDGGCGGEGWFPIYPDETGCGTICGRSCTFPYDGFSYRDTDWFTSAAVGGPVTLTCTAEFPVQLILIHGRDCANLNYELATGPPCQPISLSLDFTPDENVWVWVGPSVFNGVPESDYVLEACGLREPGACCFNPSYCFTATLDWCDHFGGRWLGYGTHCDPIPCGSDPIGACCLPSGECGIDTQSMCLGAGGIFVGAGTDCEPDPCTPVPATPTSWGKIKAGYRQGAR